MTYNAEQQKRDAVQRAADRAARAARRAEASKQATDVALARAKELAAKQSPPAPAEIVEKVGAEWSVPLTAPRGAKK